MIIIMPLHVVRSRLLKLLFALFNSHEKIDSKWNNLLCFYC